MRASVKKFLYTDPDVEADLIKHAHRLRSWIDGLEDDPALVNIDYIANLTKQASKVSGLASKIYAQAERLYREYAVEERDDPGYTLEQLEEWWAQGRSRAKRDDS